MRPSIRELRHQLASIRTDRLYLNSVALVVNTGINAAFGLVFWAIAARHFPPGAIGVITTTTSLSVLLGTVGCLGLPNALIRYLARATTAGSRLVLAALCCSQFVTLLVTCLVMVSSLAPPAAAAPPHGLLAVLLFMQATAASMIVDASLLAARRAEVIALKNLFIGGGRIACLLILLRPSSQVEILLWIQTGTSIAGSLAAGLVLFYRLLPRLAAAASGPPQLAGIARYAGSNLIAMSLGILPMAVTPLLVLRLVDPAAAAYFSFCVMLIGFLNIFASSISQSMFAEAQYGRSPGQLLRNATRSLAVVLVPAVIGFALGAPIALSLFGPEYRDNAATALQIMALGSIPSGLCFLIDAFVNGRGDSGGYLLLNLQNSVLVLAGVALGAQLHGVDGAALGWTVAQLISAVISAGYLRYSIRSRRPDRQPNSAFPRNPDQLTPDQPGAAPLIGVSGERSQPTRQPPTVDQQ